MPGLPAGAEPSNANINEAERLLVQVRMALQQHQWKRAEALATAVLALDATRQEATQAQKLADDELLAQHNYDTAVFDAERGQFNEAWNALSEVPSTSMYSEQATALRNQVRPNLVADRLKDCREAIKAEDYDEAELAYGEIMGLDPERPELAELKSQIDDGKKKHGKNHGKSSAHGKSKDSGKASKGTTIGAVVVQTPSSKSTTADDAKALYNDGVKLLKDGQLSRAIELLNRCVQIDKIHAPCYRALGIAHAKAGDGAKAARYYRLYLKVDPAAFDSADVRQLLQQYETSQ